MFHVTRLKNGLTVATAAMPHMASVSLGLWVGVGGRYEAAELNGVSHFIEHLLFKGTPQRSAKEISQAVESVGGYLNAFTAEENTCYYAKARHDRFADLLDVLMDMFLHSTFARHEIEKERGVIKDELAMYLDQPQQHVQELLNETLWPNHPLGRPLTGTEKNIETMRRGQMVGYQRRNYVAASTLVCVAGNLRHDQVVNRVARYAPEFPAGNPPCFLPVRPEQDRPRIRLFTKETAQTQIALGIRVCSRRDERRYALRLLNTLLGENMSSRLFQELRENRGLTYSVHSSVSLFEDVGVLTISAGLDVEHLPRVLRLLMRELRRLVDASPSPAELRAARDYVIGQIDLGLESTENQMMWLGENLLAYGKVITAGEVKQRLAAVKPSEIRRVARDFIRLERMSLALISPLKRPQELNRLLRL